MPHVDAYLSSLSSHTPLDNNVFAGMWHHVAFQKMQVLRTRSGESDMGFLVGFEVSEQAEECCFVSYKVFRMRHLPVENILELVLKSLDLGMLYGEERLEGNFGYDLDEKFRSESGETIAVCGGGRHSVEGFLLVLW